MIDRLRDKWFQLVWGNRFTAVHLHLAGAQACTVSAITVERKGDDLKLVDSFKAADSLEALSMLQFGQSPVALIITGKGVITKRIPRNNGGEEAQIQEQLAEYDNTWIVHAVSIQQNWVYLNIMRQEQVDVWLSKLQTIGIVPMHLLMGPSIAWEALQFLDGTTLVDTGHFRIEFNEAGISSVQESREASGTYAIGGDPTSGEHLIPYAGVISLLKETGSTRFETGFFRERLQGAYYKRATKLVGIIGVAAVFLVLLVNTGLFMHFHQKRMDLEGRLFEHQGKLTELETLQRELKRKQTMVTASGTGTHGRFTYYADQVAAVLGEDIQLVRLSVNPIQPKGPREQRITVNTDQIEVVGLCEESAQLDEWITKLHALEVVKSVRILDFGKKRDGKENEFALEITMNS